MNRFSCIIALPVLLLAGCIGVRQEAQPPGAPLGPMVLTAGSFAGLKGWMQSDEASALEAFRRSCTAMAGKAENAQLTGAGYGGTYADWREACAQAQSATDARIFFESFFTPYRVAQANANPIAFTGYYEPEIKASRTRHGVYQTPLYGAPSDLVRVDLGQFRDPLKGQRIAGRVEGGRLVPYATRADIEKNGLPNAGVLFYAADAIDAFFLQVQGSGRIALDDGTRVRAVYAGDNGQIYTSVGGILIQRGELTRENASMQSIRAWAEAHPADVPALLDSNAAYVFFAERALTDPELGAAGNQGAPLTAEASLAVDLAYHALGAPVWIETDAPDLASAGTLSYDHLLVMQDTGGAIKGAVRGDIYWGWGQEAGERAGRMRSEGAMYVLLPRAVAARLGARAEFAP